MIRFLEWLERQAPIIGLAFFFGLNIFLVIIVRFKMTIEQIYNVDWIGLFVSLPIWSQAILAACALFIGLHVIRWCLSSVTNTFALAMIAFAVGFFLVEGGYIA